MDIKSGHEVSKEQSEMKYNPWASAQNEDRCSIESYSTDHALANHENASALFSTEDNIQGEIKRMAPLNLRSGDYIFAQIASNQLMSCLL